MFKNIFIASAFVLVAIGAQAQVPDNPYPNPTPRPHWDAAHWRGICDIFAGFARHVAEYRDNDIAGYYAWQAFAPAADNFAPFGDLEPFYYQMIKTVYSNHDSPEQTEANFMNACVARYRYQ